MKRIHYPVIALILTIFASCEKDLSLELAETPTPPVVIPVPPVSKAETFQEFILTKKFQLRDFYSDVPIDYVQTDDTVRHETNLWPYASSYLKDDYDVFTLSTTELSIEQNELKMPGVPDSVLIRQYKVFEDDGGVHMTFLDYHYQPLTYDVYEFGADYFILSVRFNSSARLFSRFELVP